MFIIVVVGMLLLVAAIVVRARMGAEQARAAVVLRLVGIILTVVGLLLSSIRQINPGTVGVQVLFGKVQDDILTEGLSMVNPLMDVVVFESRTQNYTMSGVHDEGNQTGDDAIRVLTSDGLEVIIDLTVLFKIEDIKAPQILRTIGKDYSKNIVRPITRTKVRDNAVYYDAVSLYSNKRDEFQDKIYKAIAKDLEVRGVTLEQLLVRNITLPQSVKTTIESKINAEQESQKMQFVLQKEKQEADRKRIEAQGIADYQKIISMNLTDKQLLYEQIKANLELAKSTNSKVVIIPQGSKPNILIGDK